MSREKEPVYLFLQSIDNLISDYRNRWGKAPSVLIIRDSLTYFLKEAAEVVLGIEGELVTYHGLKIYKTAEPINICVF
jgi:hypothetical protein